MSEKPVKCGTTEYRLVHYWVERMLGKPSLCTECGTTEAPVFDWANLSGEYKRELSDWKRLCRSCHTYMDRTRRWCIHGHEMVGRNIWVHKTGQRVCRICKNEYNRAYRLRKKMAV